MKKIININLSGRVIPIEDSAYEKLQAYIESLRRYFINEEGRDEIINDIESRIAELLHEKVRKGAESIGDNDIEEIITSMGRVEDFEAEEKENAGPSPASAASASSSYAGSEKNTSSASSNTSHKRERTRLYRDTGDKLIGGVCSGIANYLGIDPAIIRILFAIISFGGFGLGFLAYIILWIVLPPKDLDGFTGKRLYRNPDDKMISGVAGGLAAYFGKSSNTIRLIFAAPLILNIIFSALSWPFFQEGSFVPNIVAGSLTGTFILAYVVLWIVLPEANSDYQKMEMRGEKVDVNRIRQNVREGVDNMKERMKGWSQEVKESAQNISDKAREFANTRGKAFSSEVRDTARTTSRGFGHVIGVIFKAFFLFIAGTIAFALFVGLLGILIGGVSVWPLKNFVIDGVWENIYGWGTLILFFGIPVIGFIVWLLRRIMRVKSQNNYLGWIFGGLWAIGWVCIILFVASIIKDFRMDNGSKPETELPITQPLNGKMIVQVSEPELEYSGAFNWIDIDGEGFDITQDTMKIANIEIKQVEKSLDGNYHVKIKRYSHGRSVAEAEIRAQKIQYAASFRDSILDLSSSLAIDKESKYRGQQIEVIIQVPVGKKIRFDETVEKLHAFNINIGTKKRWKSGRSTEVNIDDNTFGYATNVDYIMGEDGILKDINGVPAGEGRPAPVNNDYRYNGNTTPANPNTVSPAAADSIALQKVIEQKKKELKELEEKIKTSPSKPNGFINHQQQGDGITTSGPSPVASMAEWF
ncbi:MAG: PspC domain-containing protein [Bacteroidetes bacterium]|nr:PspC domain-containing protein [Bacteroidota bacterium]